MGNTVLKQTDTLSNGNGTKTQFGLVVHELGIDKDELIPRNCKNCHCLQTGIKKGRLILIGETRGNQQWIICMQPKNKNILTSIDHLQKNGISEDRDETATKAKLIRIGGYDSLFSLLNEIKDPNLMIHEVMNKEGNLAAFRLK